MDKLTDKDFWTNYWNRFIPYEVKPDAPFHQLLSKYSNSTSKKFIEVGGFPGTFAIYFKKFKGYDSTILDFYISREVLTKMEKKNSIEENSIHVIEADFFNYNSNEKYDVVLSAGFIEHFTDTKNVISKHVDLVKEGGDLFISLPNFRGINGFFQRVFDRRNYDIHNIDCMDIKLLDKICNELPLKNVKVVYYGKPWIWLEKEAKVSSITRGLVKIISKLISFLPVKNRYFSPFIVITAGK